MAKSYVLVTLAWAAGFQWAVLDAKQRLMAPEALFDSEHTIKGAVISAPIQYNNYTQFDFKLTELCVPHQGCNPSHAVLRLKSKPVKIQKGDNLWLKASLRRPHSHRNLGKGNPLKHYFANRIVATGMVQAIVHHFPGRQTLRDALAQKIEARVGDGIIKALVIGLSQDITPKQWEVFRRTGTGHLVAISGLHVGLVALFAYGLVFGVIGLLRVHQSIAAQPLACASSMLAAFSYSALAGFSIPTMRACIMLTVVMLFQVSVLQIPKLNLILLAALFVLIYDPISIQMAGFWLSFGAVAWLVMLNPGAQVKRFSLASLKGQIKLWLGLLPLSLAWFSHVSIVSPLTNMFAIPWMSLCVVPFALLGALLPIPFLDNGLLNFAFMNLEILMAGLQLCAQDWVMVEKHLQTSQLTLIWVGCLILLLPIIKRRFALFCFIPALCLPSYNGLTHGEFKVHFLDVGQGTSVVIELANHTVVYDFGAKSPYFDAGEQVINPVLNALHLKKIDLAVISHADLDHYGGFKGVAAKFPIQQTMTSNPDLWQADLKCRAGQKWLWDGVQFEILHPREPLSEHKNDQSCVIKISNQVSSVLLTGDIEKSSEQQLNADKLKSDVLLVPHHGSYSSSTQKFIQAVQPSYAVITAGKYNRYHLPHPQIIQRYRRQNIQVLNTCDTGMVSFKLTAKGLNRPKSWIESRAKLWDLLAIS